MSPKHDAGPQGSNSRFRLAEWSLRRKVMLILALPMLLAATLGGIQIASQVAKSDNASATASQTKVLDPVLTYLSAAEEAAVLQANPNANPADVAAATQKVQDAGNAVNAEAGKAHLTGAQQTLVTTLMTNSEGVQDGSALAAPDVSQLALSRLAEDTQRLTDAINADQTTDSADFQLLDLVIQGRLAASTQALLAAQLATEPPRTRSTTELIQQNGVEKSTIERISAAAGADPDVLALQRYQDQRLNHFKDGSFNVDLSETDSTYDGFAKDALSAAVGQLNDAARSARTVALVSIAVVGLALLATVLLALLISALLVGPIQRVRDGAIDAAERRLPEAVRKIRAGEDPGRIHPIRVGTHEEIGQLARAVDTLHESAVRLASREAEVRAQVAEMFVTLSRRNNSLVNQQLGLIENLEHDEEDPQRLDSLFRLDHLASRMRRTADSLVVLADVPIRTAAQADATAADVLQASTAGVNDYKRVMVAAAPDLQVNGAVASDVVHLLSELVDNALNYSPPTADVLVTSEQTPDGLEIKVDDGGLGMPTGALEEVNTVLRDGGEITSETARRMGLFVVSRLAHRHGAQVVLAKNDRQGITATVLLPNELLLDETGHPLAVAEVEPTPAEVLPSLPVHDDRPNQGRRTEPAAPLEEYVVGQETSTEPEDTDELSVENLEARINGVLGLLPQRRPSSNEHPGVLPPTGPVSLFNRPASAPPLPPLPAREGVAPAAAAAPDNVTALPTRPANDAPAAAFSSVVDRSEETAPVASVEEPAVLPSEASTDFPAEVTDTSDAASRAEAPEAAEVAVVASTPVEIQEPDVSEHPADEVAASAQPAVKYDPLSRDSAVTLDAGDSPIFSGIRTSWLSSDTTDNTWSSEETDSAWKVAEERTEVVEDEDTTEVGLPKRNPGIHLIPGGLAEEVQPVTRDPEAIRRRLSAHAAGVSRGRATRPTPETAAAKEAGTE